MSTRPAVNRALGLCDDVIGGSSLLWQYHHQARYMEFKRLGFVHRLHEARLAAPPIGALLASLGSRVNFKISM